MLVERELDSDGDRWQNQWLKYVAQIGVSPLPENLNPTEDVEQIADWIDEQAVPEFCRRFNACDTFRRARVGED